MLRRDADSGESGVADQTAAPDAAGIGNVVSDEIRGPREGPALADAYQGRAAWVGEEAARRIRRDVEEFREFEAPEVWEVIRSYGSTTRAAVADAVRHRRLPSNEFPADVVTLRDSHDGGASLRAMLHSYRIGQAVAAEVWAEVVAEFPDREARPRILRELTQFLFAYEDRLVDWINRQWEQHSERGGASIARLQLARRILEGESVASGELGYDLSLDHVAAIAWGQEAARELALLGTMLGTSTLVLQATDEVVWGWYGKREWEGGITALSERFKAGATGIAIAGPAAGREGFRQAHDEAGDAYVVARRTGRRLVRYGEVALEAVAMQSESASRRFMAHVLGDLRDGGRREELLRQTLTVYYGHGQNGAATAHQLGVHEQTVARRLVAAAELLGSHPSECRAEVETALRVRELLGS